MPSNQTQPATVEQDSPSKAPILTLGEITPAVMRSYETACLGFFENKDVPEDKQVCKVLAGLQDTHVQDWISVDRPRFLTLSFTNFMTGFHAGYLPEDWEEVTRIELLGMVQGSDTFWDFSVKVQAKNSLLRNTASHLDEDKLCYRIESGMSQKLVLRCRLEKSSQVKQFPKWITEIRRIDDLMRNEKSEFEALATPLGVPFSLQVWL
jgi:hypothetical protein